MLDIRYEKTANPKPIPGPENPLTFGTIFTDHMFIMDYSTDKGWYDPRIVPMHQSLFIRLLWYSTMVRKCLKD